MNDTNEMQFMAADLKFKSNKKCSGKGERGIIYMYKMKKTIFMSNIYILLFLSPLTHREVKIMNSRL